MWETPIYKMRAKSGKYVYIHDVTSSCAPGLSKNKSIDEIASFFTEKGVKTVLDFGAGALRHTLPLLDHGLSVTAVEFEEQFKRPSCRKAFEEAEKSPDFTKLIFPKQFISSRRRFDAALICFVIPTMPRERERTKLLRMIKKKMKKKAYIYWMSQYGKYDGRLVSSQRVGDGWYLHPKRKLHSFYREYKNEDIDLLMERIGFERIKVLSESGHDQFRLYARGGGTWP